MDQFLQGPLYIHVCITIASEEQAASSLPEQMRMPVLSVLFKWRLGMSLQRGMPFMSDVVKRTKSKSTASPSTQSESSFDIVDICI